MIDSAFFSTFIERIIMFYQDTIAAITTASKNGSISVIRISGSQSFELVSKIFFQKNGSPIDLCNCESHTIQYGFICDEEKNVLDEVLVLLMKAPRSYTMEDIVEIQCHGGSFICQCILELLIRQGVRVAEPGEFTKRAFLNGRIDLSQAESVMDVIQSGSKLALHNSITQLRGQIKEEITKLREMILTDIAFLEAALDDPEHIPLGNFSETMREHADFLYKEIKHLIDNSQNGRIIKEGIYTAIVGKPNVGKSSFLNCILREDRAIVTEIAGTTRDTLEEEMRIGSTLIRLVDTAGIHDSDDTVEKIGIEKAKNTIEQADFVICILDSSDKLSEEDIHVLEQAKDRQGVILLNKRDLDCQIDEEEIPYKENKMILPFSAKTGEGLKELEQYLNELFIQDNISYNDEIYITNARQKQALTDALESIKNVLQCIEDGMPEDLYSIDLLNAYESLGKIIGETIEDDIADKIFKDFCMGK